MGHQPQGHQPDKYTRVHQASHRCRDITLGIGITSLEVLPCICSDGKPRALVVLHLLDLASWCVQHPTCLHVCTDVKEQDAVTLPSPGGSDVARMVHHHHDCMSCLPPWRHGQWVSDCWSAARQLQTRIYDIVPWSFGDDGLLVWMVCAVGGQDIRDVELHVTVLRSTALT